MSSLISFFKKNIYFSIALFIIILLGLGLSFVEIIAMKEYKPSYILGINKSEKPEEEIVSLEEDNDDETFQDRGEEKEEAKNNENEKQETNTDKPDNSAQLQPSQPQAETGTNSDNSKTCYQYDNAFSVEAPEGWTCSSPAEENKIEGEAVKYELQVLRLKHKQDPLEIEFSKGPGIGITGAKEETYYENEVYIVTKFTFDSGISYIGSAKSDLTKTEPEYPKIMIHSTAEGTNEEVLINKHDREIKQIIDSYTQL